MSLVVETVILSVFFVLLGVVIAGVGVAAVLIGRGVWLLLGLEVRER
jgi:hypothetical protein